MTAMKFFFRDELPPSAMNLAARSEILILQKSVGRWHECNLDGNHMSCVEMLLPAFA